MDHADRAIATAPPAAALSFLKETRGETGWSARDLAKSLNVSAAAAKQAIPFLQAQDYIEVSKDGGGLTAAGDTVSGSKPPRFTAETLEAALQRGACGTGGRH